MQNVIVHSWANLAGFCLKTLNTINLAIEAVLFKMSFKKWPCNEIK